MSLPIMRKKSLFEELSVRRIVFEKLTGYGSALVLCSASEYFSVLFKMSWESVKFMKDDPLHLVLMMIRNLFENKIFKIIQYFVFLLHLTFNFLTIYLFIKKRDLDFITQYIAVVLATLAVVIFNFAQMINQSSVMKLRDEMYKQFWSFDCASKQLKDKLLKEAGYVKIYVIGDTSLALVTGLLLYPVGREEDYILPLHLAKINFPNIYFELKIFYGLTLGFVALTLIYLNHVMVYLTFHGTSQVLLLIEHAKVITSDYCDFEDDTLYYDENYQSEIGRRLRFIIRRHVELIKIANGANDITAKFVPMLSLAAVLMGLSLMCHWYMNLVFEGKWCYVQLAFWVFTASFTGAIFAFCGQLIEDTSVAAGYVLYNLRWITWNKSNRKMLQMLIMRASEPFQLKFLQNYVLNYDFGVRMGKLLYSFAAVINRFRDYTIMRK